MTQHHIQLENTTSNTYDLYPTNSPLSLTLSAQSSGTHFDYQTAFTNITDVLLEVDDTQKPVLVLNWPGTSDPLWSWTRTAGTTSYTSVTSGTSTKFTFDIPAAGRFSTFTLASGAGVPHALGIRVQPI